MSAPNDGGPAFPVPNVINANGDVQFGVNGMTLRDYFAAAALTGALMNYTTTNFGISETAVAECAYRYADAMLAARERKEGV